LYNAEHIVWLISMWMIGGWSHGEIPELTPCDASPAPLLENGFSLSEAGSSHRAGYSIPLPADMRFRLWPWPLPTTPPTTTLFPLPLTPPIPLYASCQTGEDCGDSRFGHSQAVGREANSLPKRLHDLFGGGGSKKGSKRGE
jgi:hypothetical protein